MLHDPSLRRIMNAISASILEDVYAPHTGLGKTGLNNILDVDGRKIVVLDDDPTGVQTVHGVSVYTDWDYQSILSGFTEENTMFYILTNSRSFSQSYTQQVHRTIARRLVEVSRQTKKDFLLISRGDSTLRGHYPLETETLRGELEELTGARYDGEVIIPFFQEGGRFTIDNIHYVRSGDELIPAGQTEFARDKSFGFSSSHLGEYCEEKSEGAYRASSMIYITLKDLRAGHVEGIVKQLGSAEHFNKIIVNAVDYEDIRIFCDALVQSIAQGKRFLFRTAASFPKVLGSIEDRKLLGRADLVEEAEEHGGIVLIGSHVQKTSQQLGALERSGLQVDFIQFDQHRVITPEGLEPEVKRVIGQAERSISEGRSVVVYTNRERFDLDTDDKEKQLEISVKISDSVTSIIGGLGIRPRFIVAKGGITSSDVGVKALRVKKALVMGQILPGVPVWQTDEGSKFPHMPYIIFPGNVGDADSLLEVVRMLM
jgi:uncharacterized protein YgbK (DUF1537 family)